MSELWLFGYGSLIWNPGFEYAQKRPAWISGWAVRFWQASLDHRGTPQAPGRVATIIPASGERVMGMAYRIEGDPTEILAYLDHREKCGYGRMNLRVQTGEGELDTFCYTGGLDSPHYVGPESAQETAAVIARAIGPSGSNLEYLMNLHQALVGLKSPSEHLIELLSLIPESGFDAHR